MALKFLHTADWQLGKPYGSVADISKRHELQRVRLESVGRLGALAREKKAAFVLVAGDFFDSTTPDKSLVAQTCAAIGKIGLPVFVIPGNHDHGGPGGVWTQEFFLTEQKAHAPNLHVLLTNDPVPLPGGGHLFPCPLLTRHDSTDTTAHLRVCELPEDAFPRVVLAHGGVADFGSDEDDRAPNRIAWEKLVQESAEGATPRFDYLALGDWHGVKQVTPRARYAGTHESDRFPKNEDYRAGRVLLVEIASRGAMPVVEEFPCGLVDWRKTALTLTAETDPHAALAGVLPEGDAVGKVALRLVVEGETGFDGMTSLRGLLDQLDARTIRFDLENRVRLRPTAQELQKLADRTGDPLLSRVAKELIAKADAGDSVASHALGKLHAAVATR